MTDIEYFTFDVTHKYFNGKKTNKINYENGYYKCGSGNDFKRYSLKKINKDIQTHNVNILESYVNIVLKTDIKKSNIFKRRESSKYPGYLNS